MSLINIVKWIWYISALIIGIPGTYLAIKDFNRRTKAEFRFFKSVNVFVIPSVLMIINLSLRRIYGLTDNQLELWIFLPLFISLIINGLCRNVIDSKGIVCDLITIDWDQIVSYRLSDEDGNGNRAAHAIIVEYRIKIDDRFIKYFNKYNDKLTSVDIKCYENKVDCVTKMLERYVHSD